MALALTIRVVDTADGSATEATYERLPVLIGRDPAACACPLGGDMRVSKVHASLDVKGGRLLVRDAQSTNGVATRGGRVPSGVWHDLGPAEAGAEVGIGRYVLQVRGEAVLDSFARTLSGTQLAELLARPGAVGANASPDSSRTIFNFGAAFRERDSAPASRRVDSATMVQHRPVPPRPTPRPPSQPPPAAGAPAVPHAPVPAPGYGPPRGSAPPPAYGSQPPVPHGSQPPTSAYPPPAWPSTSGAGAADRLAPVVARAAAANEALRYSVATELGNVGGEGAVALARELVQKLPALASDPLIARYLGTPAEPRAAESPGSAHLPEGVAFTGVQSLAQYYVDAAPPTQPEEIVTFFNKLQTGIDELVLGLQPLLAGLARFEEMVHTGAAASTVSRAPAELAEALFDWRSQDDRGIHLLRESFADLMVHQVGMLNGVMRGVQALLTELSPEAIEQAHRAQAAKRGPLGRFFASLGGGRDLWQAYARRHGDLADEENERFRVLFGPAFAAEYKTYARELRAAEGGRNRPMSLPPHGGTGTRVAPPPVPSAAPAPFPSMPPPPPAQAPALHAQALHAQAPHAPAPQPSVAPARASQPPPGHDRTQRLDSREILESVKRASSKPAPAGYEEKKKP